MLNGARFMIGLHDCAQPPPDNYRDERDHAQACPDLKPIRI
jgi:hypothetical protein